MIETTVNNLLATLILHKCLTRTQALDIAAKAGSASNYNTKIVEAKKLGISFIFKDTEGPLLGNDVVWITSQGTTKSSNCKSIW